jgi:carbamoyl-phosphate synthase large subunit
MAARLLVTSAGTGASNNVMRSLRAGNHPVLIVGCHDDQFVLKNSSAERNYLTPPTGRRGWARAIRHVLETERIDLVIPTTDFDVAALSRARATLGRRLFLPRSAALETCQDKYRLIALLRANGIHAPATYPVTDLTALDRLFRRLDGHPLVWCRARTGAGAMAAIPVRTPAQARGWIEYWQDMRGVPATAFILSEYLPGRDFSAQSVWKDGQLVLVKTYERLSYLGTGSRPAQVSSVAALARTVCEPRVVDSCVKAIRLLDPRASGVFGVDLKEDGQANPCITEINAGRFSSATNLFDLVGKHNMAATYVQVALGGQVPVRDEYDVSEDHYMLRDVDSLPRIFDVEEFFHGVGDVRDLAAQVAAHDRTGRKGEGQWGIFRSSRRSGGEGRSSGSRRRPRLRKRERCSESSRRG